MCDRKHCDNTERQQQKYSNNDGNHLKYPTAQTVCRHSALQIPLRRSKSTVQMRFFFHYIFDIHVVPFTVLLLLLRVSLIAVLFTIKLVCCLNSMLSPFPCWSADLYCNMLRSLFYFYLVLFSLSFYSSRFIVFFLSIFNDCSCMTTRTKQIDWEEKGRGKRDCS